MLDYRNPKGIADNAHLKQGMSAWRSPSNIAIVKYWGKFDIQRPRNPSISFTLSEAYTETTLSWQPRTLEQTETGVLLDFFFEGERNPAFGDKVKRFLESQIEVFPFLRQFVWSITTHNSFPHSAGIASSASAMSALSLCLVDAEQKLLGVQYTESDFMQKASYLARIGSGSACRSINPVLGVWGETGVVEGANDFYSVPFTNAHPIFHTYRDAILIVSAEEKSVSSRAGHALMDNNSFAPARYDQARRHLQKVTQALEQGDVHAFGQIAEDEALSLHALMMCSQPSFVLMRPATLEIIDRLRTWRKLTGLPLYFTLDAGPNVHLLYPEKDAPAIEDFIKTTLLPFCENQRWIADKVGQGPLKLHE